VGTDAAGTSLLQLLQATGLDTSGIVKENGFVTPAKSRIISSSQQLLRIDRESFQPITSETEQSIIKNLPTLFEGVQLVAISDYAKGFASKTLLQAIISYARSKKIPCISDPKGSDFSKYAGSTILKPNALETMVAAQPDARTLEEAAHKILKNVAVDILMVTRSEDGISVFYPNGHHELYPVSSKEVRDVTGAGDTVLAMVSAGYACGLSLQEILPLANIAATCSIERIGCAQITLRDVASRILEQHPHGKIWGGSSFVQLTSLLPQERFLVIRIPEHHTLGAQEVIRLSELARQHHDRRSVAYFTGSVQDPKILELVASLQCVQFVLHNIPDEHQKLLETHLLVDL
jgi:D-beta-D-heptose 7-phosphate kinase/D-beta-D-heptose 1-phosphate adenosyltransferase